VSAQVLGFDHLSVLVADAEKALAFYQEILGLQTVDRPNLGFPGYWLDLQNGQTIHLMQLNNPYTDIERPEHGGRDFHFALRVKALDAFVEQLEQRGLPFTQSKSGRKALFFKDLDNNVIELYQTV